MKGRILALAFLLPSIGAISLEYRSPVAHALRRGEPLQTWVSAKDDAGNQRLYWALYHPGPGILDLVYVASAAGQKQLRDAVSQYHSLVLPGPDILGALPAQLDPALALKARLGSESSGLHFWKSLPKTLKTGALPRFDRFILALALRRLGPGGIHPAWLPDQPSRSAFLERLFDPEARPPQPARKDATVEILNASGQKGVALEATKFLRSQGIDVVYFGNTSVWPQSVIYDRAGDAATAEMLRKRLGCPRASVVTHIQPEKLLDMTIVLAADCVEAFARPAAHKEHTWSL